MSETATRQRVWDWTLRVFHWSLAVAFAGLWWTAENGQMDWHVRVGMITCGLLAFRFYWGFAGPPTARFAHFIKGPGRVFAYLRGMFSGKYRPAFGHNPLGGLSVLALLFAFSVQLVAGLFAEDVDGLSSGPLSRFVSYDTGRAAAEFHEASFNIVLALVILHLAAIAFYLVALKTNLIGAMVTGSRHAEDGTPDRSVRTPPVRAAIGIALAAALVGFLFTI